MADPIERYGVTLLGSDIIYSETIDGGEERTRPTTALGKEVNQAVAGIITKAMTINPEKRYVTKLRLELVVEG